jgi:hypothetical protein
MKTLKIIPSVPNYYYEMIKLEVRGKTIALCDWGYVWQEAELDEKIDKLHKHYIDNPKKLEKKDKGI